MCSRKTVPSEASWERTPDLRDVPNLLKTRLILPVEFIVKSATQNALERPSNANQWFGEDKALPMKSGLDVCHVVKHGRKGGRVQLLLPRCAVIGVTRAPGIAATVTQRPTWAMQLFLTDGYVVLDDFLTEMEVAELQRAGEQLTKDIPEESKRAVFSTTHSQQSKDKYFLDSADKVSYFFEASALNEKGELQVEPQVALNKVGHALHWLHPTFKKLTFSEKVKEACFQLGFEDPSVTQSMYIYKNPGLGSEVVPHQDATFLHTEPVYLVGFWIALEDATLENGCLWFSPGSHRSGVHRRFVRNPDHNSTELLVFTAPPPCYPTSNFTPVPVKKGKEAIFHTLQNNCTCILIHGLVVHRSDPNKSSKSRHAYTFHVIDSKNVTYSPDNWLQLKPGESFPSLYKN
uniref:Phytanoyl-CoA dioxygenase domain containing 1 n=1 Tax=Timema douglasi TaxID=61478 RepID=A0A7R8VCK1_TIMDO|nr:unnamed protein product [Timema douglasi]